MRALSVAMPLLALFIESEDRIELSVVQDFIEFQDFIELQDFTERHDFIERHDFVEREDFVERTDTGRD